MEPGTYMPSPHRNLLGWGGILLVGGIGLFSFAIVALAIGVFDKFQIQSDAQVTFVISVPVLIAAIGFVLIIVGLFKRFKTRA